MPQQRKRGMSPDWDSDLKKQRSKMQAAEKLQKSIAARAKANSKSPIKGMDNVDYEGENRWNYNIGIAKAEMARMKIREADSQQLARDAQRRKQNESIKRRMNK
jgi:hypothetical protein